MTGDERTLDARIAEVVSTLREAGSVIAAFSGGVDSALLSDLAVDALGSRALVVTAVSPSLPEDERRSAEQTATARGWPYRQTETYELDREQYATNGPDRCFHCRTELVERLTALRSHYGIEHLAIGTIADDLGDHRPGISAARRAGVLMPLADAGLSKADVRHVAAQRGLEVWDKPASACLSSRIPYGQRVTRDALRRVELAERALHTLGFRECRVRDHDRCARIEVPAVRIDELVRRRDEISARLREVGYLWVSVDLDGLRSGSLNASLPVVRRP